MQRRSGSGRPARIVIADDHDLARAGIRRILEGERDWQIIGETSDGKSTLALCRRSQPDLLMLDLRMPDMDGLAVCRAVRKYCPRTRIVMVTMYENPDYVREALRAGVSGYVLKYSRQQDIVKVVRSALSGSRFADPAAIEELENELTAGSTAWQLRDRLTPREHEVLRLVSKGMTNRSIAEALSISPATVKIHVEHIIAKLEVFDRTEAAAKAAAYGLL